MAKEQLTMKEKIIIFITTIIFISPAFFVQEGPRFLYALLAGVTGWSIGKRILFYLKTKRNKLIDVNNRLLNNLAIRVYIIAYVILSIIIDFKFLQAKFLLYLLKIIISTDRFLYYGLIGLRTKKMYLRGGQMSKKLSVMNAIILILLAILSLFYTLIFR